MKKIYFFALLLGALINVSCSSDTDETNNDSTKDVMVKKTFTVGTPSATSRAVVSGVDDQNPQVNWESTDELKVWSLGSTTSYKFTSPVTGYYKNYADFSTDMPKSVIDAATKFIVMYPYKDATTIDASGVITTTLPQEQEATSNSFDPQAALCTGATQNNSDVTVSLQHACAFLKIKLTSACQNVTVSAGTRSSDGKQQYLAGNIKITPNSSGSPITVTDSSVGSVKLIPSGNNTIIPAGTYLISVITSTGVPDLTVKVKFSDSVTKTGTASISSLEAAHIYYLGTVGE